MPQTFLQRSTIPATPHEVYVWHAEPGALRRLIPPWEAVEVEEDPGLREGGVVKLRVRIGPLRLSWWSRLEEVRPGSGFLDVQIQGPFTLWEHTHAMEPDGAGGCLLEDRILYKLPFGWLGRMFGGRLMRRKLRRVFEFRHEVTRQAFSPPDSAGRAAP